MSADVHEKFLFKEEQSLFRYCNGNLSFTATSHDDDYNYNKKKMSRDPMSHRIIEKRRRDRMNNCLADLSRLIPPEYLKKGRGRIEKTEIIEMAIKHMRHLQSIIASSRFTENSDNSVPSPPATTGLSREAASLTGDQPIVIEHYRLGYLECLSEAMHFLVEVQGYFAGDSLCVQMINHLHKHCDKILKGHTLSFPKKHNGEASGSESSTSPANGTFNNSPPLGMSNSTGSTSDDNQPNLNFEAMKQFEICSRNLQVGHRSPRRYSDTYPKNSETPYPRYAEREGTESENRSDSELHQNFVLKLKNNEMRKDDSKNYLNNFETGGNFGPKNYGIYVEESGGFENMSVKEENGNGPSQLREMLTSPSSNQTAVNLNKTTNEKGNTSPASNTSCCESSPCHSHSVKSSLAPKNFKDSGDGNSDFSEVASDNHHMMYKFKNNIKQRFSKEKRENPECDINGDASTKKQKPNEDYLKHSDPLMRERLNLLDRIDVEEEKVFKFNADFENKKRIRYASESEIPDVDISNRLSFGHKSSEKGKRWEETMASFPYQSNQKLWSLSSNESVPFFSSQASLGCKPSTRQTAERNSSLNNSFNNISTATSESGPGIPIFALHAKGFKDCKRNSQVPVMGSFYSTTFYEGKTPEHYPESYGKPSFDPELGFKAPRKERVSKLSLQEMKALKIPPNERDYCAHLMRDYIVCYRNYSPFFGMCYPEMRAYEHCETEDYILRMKEYERERRLKIRELKKQGKTIS